MPRSLAVLLSACALAVAILVGSFPLHTWLGQRHSLAAAAAQLRSLDSRNRQLEARASQLRQLSEVGLLARARYGLVPKGVEAFVILPRATPGAEGRAAPHGH